VSGIHCQWQNAHIRPFSQINLQTSYSIFCLKILPAFTSFARAIEVVQRYQLNDSHDGAEHNEARAEDPLTA
jgi:hypothetical protein